MTTIFVTHDQEEAFELADRVVIMGEGRIEQAGTPDEIYENPESPQVARFLGGVNEIPAALHGGRVVLPGADTSALPRMAAGDGAITLFVRPQEIELVPAPDSPARIASVSSNGARLRFDVTIAGVDKAVEAEIGREARHVRSLKPGDAVRLAILRGRVFEPAAPMPGDDRESCRPVNAAS